MQRRNLVLALIAFVLYLLLVPALLFVSAGTLNWPMAWVYTILLLVSTCGSRLVVYRRNPDTLRERARFTSSENTQRWDRVLVIVMGLLGPVGVMVVAGLDYRFGWSDIVPPTIQFVAALAVAGGFAVGVWAMVANPYFSSVARIQKDRGQTVVASGPYRFVRHPAYAGAVIAALAIPIMLDSIWALLPSLAIVVGVIIRTDLEDKMLREGLSGYEAYAHETPRRLIPRLW